MNILEYREFVALVELVYKLTGKKPTFDKSGRVHLRDADGKFSRQAPERHREIIFG